MAFNDSTVMLITNNGMYGFSDIINWLASSPVKCLDTSPVKRESRDQRLVKLVWLLQLMCFCLTFAFVNNCV